MWYEIKSTCIGQNWYEYIFLKLDGKLVEPKVAVPRKTNPKLVMRTRKIFVGGLSATTSLEDIKNYFEQFSKVS